MAKNKRRKKNRKRNQIKNSGAVSSVDLSSNITVATTNETLAVLGGTCFPKLRPRVRLGNNIEIVPKGCIIHQSNYLAFQGTTVQRLQPSPIMLEKVGEIIIPYKLHKRNRGNHDKPFVPRSCITGAVSLVPTAKKRLVNLKNNLTPSITGRFAPTKRPQPLGKNIVIVPSSCIIPPTIITSPSPSPRYDWRTAFPEPIKLKHVPDIIEPRLNLRTKKYTTPTAIFVPQGCIITPEKGSTQHEDDTPGVVVAAVADQAALAQEAPIEESDNFSTIASTAVVLFAIFLLLLLTRL